MGARNKINGMYGLGIVAFAGIWGLAFQSWTVFLVIAAVLVGYCILSGDIRIEKPRRRK